MKHSVGTIFASLQANYDFSIAASNSTPPRSPFADLQERVEWARHHIWFYNAILILLLLLVSSSQWTHSRRDVIRDDEYLSEQDEDADGSASDSSSTLTGTATPPDLAKSIQDESSPLLRTSYTRFHAFHWSRGLAYVYSLSMYQPRPIFQKALPSNGTTLLIVSFIGLNTLFVFINIPFQSRMVFVYADRFAQLFAANLPLLYLLAAKNQPIKRLTGFSYEGLNLFHRRVGEMLCLFAFLHMAGTFAVWFTVLRPLGFTLLRFISNHLVLNGIGAFVCYEVLYFSSLSSFRQRWYELFLASHIFLQIGGLVFLWFHYWTSRIYVLISLGIFVVDRVVFRLFMKSTKITAGLQVLEDGETVLLSADWAIVPSSSRGAVRMSVLRGWHPADHVFVTIPALSSSAAVQAHPFTIASAAPDLSADNPYAWLSLLIRSHAGFSRTLLEYAKLHSSVEVRLDGPYGSVEPLRCLENSDLAVVVAGGSGIAVCFPLVWALLCPPSGTTGDGWKLRQNKRRVCLIWIVHSSSHRSWVPQERLNELKNWGLDLRILPPTGLCGRPDVGAMVEELAYESSGRTGTSPRVGVVVSGPDALNRDVRNCCSRLVRQGLDTRVMVEKFGW